MFSFNGSDSNYLKYKELSNRFEGVPFFDIFFFCRIQKKTPIKLWELYFVFDLFILQ